MYKLRQTALRCIMVTLLPVLSLSVSYGQPKALGAVFSFTGFSISYEHNLKGYEAFVETSIKVGTADMFLRLDEVPGFSASVGCNYPIAEFMSVNGNRLTFFAGPGLTCGVGRDYKSTSGMFAGLEGRTGIECNFSRKMVISASVAPILGVHMNDSMESLRMRFFRNGLIYGLIPEIGIKYRFGR